MNDISKEVLDAFSKMATDTETKKLLSDNAVKTILRTISSNKGQKPAWLLECEVDRIMSLSSLYKKSYPTPEDKKQIEEDLNYLVINITNNPDAREKIKTQLQKVRPLRYRMLQNEVVWASGFAIVRPLLPIVMRSIPYIGFDIRVEHADSALAILILLCRSTDRLQLSGDLVGGVVTVATPYMQEYVGERLAIFMAPFLVWCAATILLPPPQRRLTGSPWHTPSFRDMTPWKILKLLVLFVPSLFEAGLHIQSGGMKKDCAWVGPGDLPLLRAAARWLVCDPPTYSNGPDDSKNDGGGNHTNGTHGEGGGNHTNGTHGPSGGETPPDAPTSEDNVAQDEKPVWEYINTAWHHVDDTERRLLYEKTLNAYKKGEYHTYINGTLVKGFSQKILDLGRTKYPGGIHIKPLDGPNIDPADMKEWDECRRVLSEEYGEDHSKDFQRSNCGYTLYDLEHKYGKNHGATEDDQPNGPGGDKHTNGTHGPGGDKHTNGTHGPGGSKHEKLHDYTNGTHSSKVRWDKPVGKLTDHDIAVARAEMHGLHLYHIDDLKQWTDEWKTLSKDEKRRRYLLALRNSQNVDIDSSTSHILDHYDVPITLKPPQNGFANEAEAKKWLYCEDGLADQTNHFNEFAPTIFGLGTERHGCNIFMKGLANRGKK